MRINLALGVAVALAALTAGCGKSWPKDTMAAPTFAEAATFPVAKHHLIAYSVPAEVKLPKWVKPKGANEFVGPAGAEIFVMLSKPWPTEEEAMEPVMDRLLAGKPFDHGDAMVVARPWIGSREPKDPQYGKQIDRYLLMTEDLFLDMVVRVPLNNEAAKKEGADMVQYLVHSIKRVTPSQAAYRLTNAGNPPPAIASAASPSSLR